MPHTIGFPSCLNDCAECILFFMDPLSTGVKQSVPNNIFLVYSSNLFFDQVKTAYWS